MIKKLLIHAALAGTALLFSATPLLAGPTIYFGENQTPGQTVTGAPLAAKNAFLGQLTGVGTETFEGFNAGDTVPLPITFAGGAGNIVATLNGTGEVAKTIAPSPGNPDPNAGRFNTTGATAAPSDGKWWDVSGDFGIDFDVAISAFGFYGTDIGDFSGQVTVDLTDTSGVVHTFIINNKIGGNNASLLFWGFTDTGNSYTKIVFGNTNPGLGGDFFGFDDMIVGDKAQIVPPGSVPEPGPLALIGLGLVGLAASRQRR